MEKKRISAEAYQKLKKDLEYLKKEKRKEISEKLRQAISFGDLKENAAYHEAKDEQGFVEGKIIELENIIKNSSIASSNEKSDKVLIGSKVEILINGDKNEYTVVEALESDPLKGKLSSESPIGKALLNKKKGDSCQVEMPSGEKINIEILEIK